MRSSHILGSIDLQLYKKINTESQRRRVIFKFTLQLRVSALFYQIPPLRGALI